jgi:putative two-component system response regulator
MSRRTRPLVLVVEDDAANRVLLSRRLARAGYDSLALGTGPEGLQAALEGEPDLLLLDVELPGLDGFEICRRLRADPRTVALPIILLTGRTSRSDVITGLDAGADDFLRKPYDEAELMARVRSVLRLTAAMAEVAGAHGVMAALANAVEAKDATTEVHCERLASLAHQLATAVGIEPADLRPIVFGAMLHDVGKIGVSDAILKKPGPLTQDEWVEMRRHPVIGERICLPLASSASFGPIVRHHHERWDGKGYPDGLRGDAIPLGARIVGVVDAFDAIVHARPYRAARTTEDALSELHRERGRQFDPTLVEVFVRIVEGDLGLADEGLTVAAFRTLNAAATA